MMSESVQTVIKRWGNSFGIILPMDIARKENLAEDDVVQIKIEKKIRPIKTLFKTFGSKKPTQDIKDELKAGWDA